MRPGKGSFRGLARSPEVNPVPFGAAGRTVDQYRAKPLQREVVRPIRELEQESQNGNSGSVCLFLKRVKEPIVRPSERDNRGELLRALRSIVSALEVTDLIALMMVLATVLSAYATWKIQQVTTQILLISQRPYIGTESMNLINDTSPRVLIDLRNFGTVQAEDTVVSVVLRINGKVLPRESEP